MDKEQAVNFLRSSGLSDDQIIILADAFINDVGISDHYSDNIFVNVINIYNEIFAMRQHFLNLEYSDPDSCGMYWEDDVWVLLDAHTAEIKKLLHNIETILLSAKEG